LQRYHCRGKQNEIPVLKGAEGHSCRKEARKSPEIEGMKKEQTSKSLLQQEPPRRV